MNKLKDVNNVAGFFTTYQTNNSTHFAELFGTDLTTADIQGLDFLLSDLYGERVLTNGLAEIFKKDGATECQNKIVFGSDVLFFEQWKQLKTTIENAIETNVNSPLTETKNITESRYGTSSGNNQNKTNAFDDTVNASNTDSSERADEHADTIERSEMIQRSNGLTPAENAVKVIEFARNNDFMNTLMHDIADYATLKVF